MYKGINKLCDIRLSIENLQIEKYKGYQYRTMDLFSKMAIGIVDKLLANFDLENTNSERVGIVLSSPEGPSKSLDEIYSLYIDRGYIGMNPSKFPNIMKSTSLMYCSKRIMAHGPSTSLYEKEGDLHALKFATMQIMNGRCDYMFVVWVIEGIECRGMILEKAGEKDL
jgi:3-oxoacyl-(acyl-carrier-protein) synthase